VQKTHAEDIIDCNDRFKKMRLDYERSSVLKMMDEQNSR